MVALAALTMETTILVRPQAVEMVATQADQVAMIPGHHQLEATVATQVAQAAMTLAQRQSGATMAPEMVATQVVAMVVMILDRPQAADLLRADQATVAIQEVETAAAIPVQAPGLPLSK